MDNKQRIIQAVKSMRKHIEGLEEKIDGFKEQIEYSSMRYNELMDEAHELGITKEELK